jgi:hypothetical protein
VFSTPLQFVYGFFRQFLVTKFRFPQVAIGKDPPRQHRPSVARRPGTDTKRTRWDCSRHGTMGQSTLARRTAPYERGTIRRNTVAGISMLASGKTGAPSFAGFPRAAVDLEPTLILRTAVTAEPSTADAPRFALIHRWHTWKPFALKPKTCLYPTNLLGYFLPKIQPECFINRRSRQHRAPIATISGATSTSGERRGGPRIVKNALAGHQKNGD